jgi:hypothetical protein
MTHRALAFISSLLFCVLVAACASQPEAEDTASGDSGPTIYGQLGVSVDHATVK